MFLVPDHRDNQFINKDVHFQQFLTPPAGKLNNIFVHFLLLFSP